jgi:hypothetical protein
MKLMKLLIHHRHVTSSPTFQKQNSFAYFRSKLVATLNIFHYCVDGSSLSTRGADKSLARPGKKQATATEDFEVSHILFIIINGGILVPFIYIRRLASNKIFSPSNKIHREVGQAKDLSAPLYIFPVDAVWPMHLSS